jgi:hypothetical protein
MKLAIFLISTIKLATAWSPGGPAGPCPLHIENNVNAEMFDMTCGNKCEITCDNLGVSIYEDEEPYCKPGCSCRTFNPMLRNGAYIRNDDGVCVPQKRNSCGEWPWNLEV